MKKIKQTYFPHDSNARNDIKLIKLRSKYGYEGYGIYFALIELLFSEDNNLCIEDYDTLAFGLQCNPDILKDIIINFDLFIIEDNCFYSKRLDDVINEIQSKSKKASENASKRWNNAKVMPTHSDSNAIKLNKTKQNNIKQRIEDFKKSIHAIEDISDEDKDNFFLYWTEKNKSGSKFRAELQRTFDINLRLKRWASNGFNKNKKAKYLDYYDKFAYSKLDNTGRQEYLEHLKQLGFESVYSPTAGTTWRKKQKI